MDQRIALFTSNGRKFCDIACEIAKSYFPRIEIVKIDRRPDRKYAEVFDGMGAGDFDVVLSFLSPAVMPADILSRSPLNVNFHPGNSHYPGSGCFNFAIYEEARVYGSCCHHMEATVDTGKIIYEENFPLSREETVETLQLKAWATLLEIFNRFLREISAGKRTFDGDLKEWRRKPFKARQLDELSRIDASMSDAEIRRRIRATSYPGFPPKLAGVDPKFRVSDLAAEPLVERVFR
ncbi:MAG: hypothetical protein IH905_04135 [Proteobacteria bacterium]|nr:hypothetical protein [Pseudomonadota bacterium]